ncbi:hypothetical protein, partial [Nocardia abscessus]|uniref:hypothetical protein n=1 Tax=Nocardia abscessus TaxID=120957 RepID=UPI002454368F
PGRSFSITIGLLTGLPDSSNDILPLAPCTAVWSCSRGIVCKTSPAVVSRAGARRGRARAPPPPPPPRGARERLRT